MIDIILEDVKEGLGIKGDYQDGTLRIYVEEVIDFLVNAGVKEENMKTGIITRGVSDLWNYGGAKGTLSDYFIQRATQLTYK